MVDHSTGTPLRMAVNLSPRQFQDGDVVADVVAALEETGFPAAQLTLEVTEGVLVRDVDAVVAQLEALRALGIRIAIDDFGTGFSGLSYLRHLPADIIKIDRSFVSDLPTGRSATTLITSIVELARTLGLDVVAEGVETEDQRQALARARLLPGPGVPVRPPRAGRPVRDLPPGVRRRADRPHPLTGRGSGRALSRLSSGLRNGRGDRRSAGPARTRRPTSSIRRAAR